MFRLRTIERPITHTLRLLAAAASITCCRRWICDANDVTITRPGAFLMISRIDGPTVASDGVVPGFSALVESDISTATPSRPSAASRSTSAALPSIGVMSSLKSPVWMIVPWSVRSTTATASGIECVSRTNSAWNGPTSRGGSSGLTSTRLASAPSPCSSSFDLTRPSVSRVPSTSGCVPTSRSRYGSAPT